MNSKKTIYWVLGAIAITVVGIIVIPPLLKKCGVKLYRSSAKSEEIDFDNLGPEIVKKDKTEEK